MVSLIVGFKEREAIVRFKSAIRDESKPRVRS